jgi:hypothetical protein
MTHIVQRAEIHFCPECTTVSPSRRLSMFVRSWGGGVPLQLPPLRPEPRALLLAPRLVRSQ